MPQRAEPPKIWERNELKFLGIDLIVMLHLRSPDILIEEVQGAFLPRIYFAPNYQSSKSLVMVKWKL